MSSADERCGAIKVDEIEVSNPSALNYQVRFTNQTIRLVWSSYFEQFNERMGCVKGPLMQSGCWRTPYRFSKRQAAPSWVASDLKFRVSIEHSELRHLSLRNSDSEATKKASQRDRLSHHFPISFVFSEYFEYQQLKDPKNLRIFWLKIFSKDIEDPSVRTLQWELGRRNLSEDQWNVTIFLRWWCKFDPRITAVR